MRYQKIIPMFWRSPQRDVLMEEANALGMTRQLIFDALPGQLQHPLARVDTIDFDLRMHPQQFTQKSSIPLAYH